MPSPPLPLLPTAPTGNLTNEAAGIDIEAEAAAISGGTAAAAGSAAASAAIGSIAVCVMMVIVVVRRRRARAKRHGLAKVPEDDRRTAFPFVQTEGERDCSGSQGTNSTPRRERDASLDDMCPGGGCTQPLTHSASSRGFMTGTRSLNQQHHRMNDEADGGEWKEDGDDTSHESCFGIEHEGPTSARDMRGGASMPLSRVRARAGSQCGLPDVRDTGRVSGAPERLHSRERSRFSASPAKPPPEPVNFPAPGSSYPDARHSNMSNHSEVLPNHQPVESEEAKLGINSAVVEEEDEDDDEDDEGSSSSSRNAAAYAEIGTPGGNVLRTAPPRRSNSFERISSLAKLRGSSVVAEETTRL